MIHTVRKKLCIIISAIILLCVPLSLCACTPTGPVAQDIIILTADDYESSKDGWFNLFSRHMDDNVRKKAVDVLTVDAEYYCVFSVVNTTTAFSRLRPYGELDLTLDGSYENLEILDRTGNLNSCYDTLGSSWEITFGNGSKTTLTVSQSDVYKTQFSLNNEVTAFQFTAAVKFKAKTSGKINAEGRCFWADVNNIADPIEAYARYPRHVDVNGFSMKMAKASDCINGAIPENINLIGSDLQINTSYFITVQFTYNSQKDFETGSEFNAVSTLNSDNFVLYETSSSEFTSGKTGNVTDISVKFTLPASQSEMKSAKITLRFTPERTGSYSFSFTLYGEEMSFTETTKQTIDFYVR